MNTGKISILLCLLFCSCVTQHVSRPITSEYAPKNYKQRGVIKYLNQGADFIIDSRKEDAFREMSTVCNGSYSIISEGAREEGGIVTQTSSSSLGFFPSQYWYMSYECEKK